MANILRFVILGDDRGGPAFASFTRQVEKANAAVDRNNAALKRQGAATKNIAGLTDSAARRAKVLQTIIEQLGKKENRTAAESEMLAKALRLTGDAEDRAAAKALAADAAVRRLGDAMQDSQKKTGGLRKALGDLKPNPGLLGPAVALLPAIGTLGGVAAGAVIGLGGAFTAAAGSLAVFGTVAKPVLTDAKKAADAVSKAQGTYNATIKAGVPTAQAQATLQKANASAQLTYNAALQGGANPAKALAAYHLALSRNQSAYNSATSKGTFNAKAYAAEQNAIGKAYAGMSPAQIALSKQLGLMADAWDKVKKAETPVVAGALTPWLKSVTDLTKNLGPIIAKIAPVIAYLGTKFDALVNSAAFKGFRDFIGSTGSAAVSAGGSTIIDLVKSFIILLPKFDPLIREAVGWISRLGPAVLKWASSKKTADQIQSFMQWFSQNGSVIGGLLTNIGGALKALAPGLTAGGAAEIKIVSDFLGFVAKLPPAVAKPLAEVAGAALILSKMGVLKVGLKVVGPAAKWLSGGLINLGGGATAGAEIRAAMVSGGAAAAAEIRAAMTGGGAAAGAGTAAGGATAGRAAGGGFLAGLSAAVGPAISGVLAGLMIRGIGDTLSPKGTFAGRLNANLQSIAHTSGGIFSTNLLHSFTFGGLEAWMATHFGQPVGGALNNVASGARIWGKGFVSSVGGFFSSVAHGAGIAFGHVAGSAQSGFAAAGRHADALRTRNLVPLLGEFGKVSGGVQGLAGVMQNTLLNAERVAGQHSDNLRTRNLSPLRGEFGRVSGGVQGLQGYINRGLAPAMDTGGRHADNFRTRNLGPLRGELAKNSGGVQGLQRYINLLHGKTVTVGVHGSGSGGAKITISSVGGGPFAGKLVAISNRAAGGMITGGTPGKDSVLARLMPGEVVVPTPMVKAGAVDHLRGRLPGFAAGGLVDPRPFVSRTEGSYGTDAKNAFGAEAAQAFKAAVASATAAVKAELGGSGQAVLNYALRYLHKVPYVWGGSTPSGWDCSGYVSWVLDHLGLFHGRTDAAGFQRWARPSPPVPGGLAFYGNPAHHVGFVMPGGRLLSALGHAFGTTISALKMGDNSGYGIPPRGFGPGGASAAGPGGSKLKELAFTLLSQYGWANQWPAFNSLENREASWSMTARNPSSGAYGLAQFINGPSEYFQYGGNPNTALGQLTAMLNYIGQRYRSPDAAWAHEVSAGWYDRGGYLQPGWNLAYNGTGRPEPVGHAAGGGNTYNITVNVPATASKADTGRVIVEHIRAYEQGSGKGWRR